MAVSPRHRLGSSNMSRTSSSKFHSTDLCKIVIHRSLIGVLRDDVRRF